MWKIVLSQFVEHRMAVVGTFIIAVFSIIALSAPLIESITGLDPDAQNVFNRYQKPFSRAMAGQDVRESTVEKFILDKPAEAQALETALREQSLIANPKPGEALFEL